MAEELEGERCQDCKDIYTDDYWLPDEWWELITPKPENPGAGLLCPDCALTRLVERTAYERAKQPKSKRKMAAVNLTELQITILGIHPFVQHLPYCDKQETMGIPYRWFKRWFPMDCNCGMEKRWQALLDFFVGLDDPNKRVGG